MSGRAPITDFAVTLRVGFEFSDDHLDEKERFVDTDTLDQLLADYAARLSGSPWTELFDHRPTFKYVSRWLHQQLTQHIPQLIYASLENDTIGVVTVNPPVEHRQLTFHGPRSRSA
ncbi:hypothetical protein [Nocardia sp. NBC_01388]|uniref:hypothetical protein n=1 Tax=Nocardia sp. NBC_01388 TaxID=2903596 RepID=UPI0032492938